MQSDDDYSLINVVRHLKYSMENTYGDYYLTLEYKYAKPNQSTEGNKKFEKIIQSSYQKVMVMNANRQMKKKPYVHLKSMTYPKQFSNFTTNLESLQKIHQLKIDNFHKIDLNFDGQKISFESELMKWVYKNRRVLFKPSYQTVKDGKLFRISLYSQAKRIHQPKKKVIDVLGETITKAIQREKNIQKSTLQANNKDSNNTQTKDTRENRQIPLRFKIEQTFALNKWIYVVMSQVYQSVNIKLYQQILQLVNTRKNSTNQLMGKMLLSELTQDIFKEFKEELTYEVELRFSSDLIKQFQELHQEQIEDILVKAAQVFMDLSKDPKQFSAEEIVKDLQDMQNMI